MSSISQVVITKADDSAILTLSVPGDPKSPYIARNDHPNFKAMIGAVATGALEDLPPLFDVAETIAIKFQRLSERVTVENGQVLFDGATVNSTLTQHILDVLQEGATDASWSALVNFFEKVQTNPDTNSREQLYDWIKAQDGLTITEAGDMVGYKYVITDDTHGYRSSSSGKEPVRVTFADGTSEVFTGRIPNPLGGLVEMPRDLVDSDPSRTCSVGLHIGAWNYVKGNSHILEVHVNPRDVVAVPSDYNGEKVRACRYTVVGPITEKYGQAVKVEGEAPKPRAVAAAPATRDDLDVALDPVRTAMSISGLTVGTRVVDYAGDEGVIGHGYVEQDDSTGFYVEYDDSDFGRYLLENDQQVANLALRPVSGTSRPARGTARSSSGKPHGKGGRTSNAAKGRGKNPDQDASGRFTHGRSNSVRDGKGRFVR